MNSMSRFHLAAEAIRRVPRLADRAPALIAECEARGYWKLLSRIFPQNEASLALARSLGFREVGVYRRHGQLEGEWLDCVIVEILLGAAR